MIGNLLVRFRKGEEQEIFEGEFIIGLDNESNLEEYVNNCLEDIVAQVSGEGLDSDEEVSELEYYFDEMPDLDTDSLTYDWR